MFHSCICLYDWALQFVLMFAIIKCDNITVYKNVSMRFLGRKVCKMYTIEIFNVCNHVAFPQDCTQFSSLQVYEIEPLTFSSYCLLYLEILSFPKSQYPSFLLEG